MRLKLLINEKCEYTAQIRGNGYLSGHLNLYKRKGKTKNGIVRIVGYETKKTETRCLEWSEKVIGVGDKIEFNVLANGNSNNPKKIRVSSEDKYTLFKKLENGKKVKKLVTNFMNDLQKILLEIKKSENKKECRKFRLSIGHVMAEIMQRILDPIYRKHSKLIPKVLQGELFIWSAPLSCTKGIFEFTQGKPISLMDVNGLINMQKEMENKSQGSNFQFIVGCILSLVGASYITNIIIDLHPIFVTYVFNTFTVLIFGLIFIVLLGAFYFITKKIFN